MEHMLDQRRFAVVGASRDPEKFGYQVFKALKAVPEYTVYAVNPNADEIDGTPCYPSLDNLPGKIDCVVTVTPPDVTEEVMRTSTHLKIPYVWMQPGSDSTPAFNIARAGSMQIVSGGPCIMVAVRERRARALA
jgi:predicted CoA-binding protein